MGSHSGHNFWFCMSCHSGQIMEMYLLYIPNDWSSLLRSAAAQFFMGEWDAVGAGWSAFPLHRAGAPSDRDCERCKMAGGRT